MRWQGRRQSTNVDDRRGQGGGFGGSGPRIGLGIPGGRGGGGLGLGFIAVVLIVGWIAGVNPLELLSQMDGSAPVTRTGGGTTTERLGTPGDEQGQFVATVLAETEDTWKEIFAAEGARYEPPILRLFTSSTESPCGFASAAVGPFYCPGDKVVYLDLGFFDELSDRFNAPGDFAQAYVIAHEIGHHVQNLLGTLPEVDRARRQSDEVDGNRVTVRLELQADCYAGIWAHVAEKEGILEVGDIDEALNAASQIGDDTLQKQTQGYVVPDSFTHGSAAQRSRWFKRGYNQGTIAACDTFTPNDV